MDNRHFYVFSPSFSSFSLPDVLVINVRFGPKGSNTKGERLKISKLSLGTRLSLPNNLCHFSSAFSSHSYTVPLFQYQILCKLLPIQPSIIPVFPITLPLNHHQLSRSPYSKNVSSNKISISFYMIFPYAICFPTLPFNHHQLSRSPYSKNTFS